MQIRKKAGLRCIAAVFLLFILATGTVLASDLLLAAAAGNLEMVERLLSEGWNVNERDGNGLTVLMYAVAEGHPGLVQTLIEAGANVQARTVTGVTALMVAEEPVIVRMLLDAGADVDLRDFKGKTA